MFKAVTLVCYGPPGTLLGEAKQKTLHHIGSSVAAPNVRLLDANGVAASVGLLQVRMQGSQNAEFGSVCGMNLARAIFNFLGRAMHGAVC